MAYEIFDAIDLPGWVKGYFTDGRITLHETLKSRTEQKMTKLSAPEVSYSLDAADLSNVRISASEKISIGDRVRVVDEDHGFVVSTFIVGIDRPLDDPAKTKLQFETRWRDVTELLGDLAKESIRPKAPLELIPDNINLGHTPAEELALEAVTPPISPEIPPHSMRKWTHPTDKTQIDGKEIFDGSIQKVFLARITAVTSS